MKAPNAAHYCFGHNHGNHTAELVSLLIVLAGTVVYVTAFQDPCTASLRLLLFLVNADILVPMVWTAPSLDPHEVDPDDDAPPPVTR